MIFWWYLLQTFPAFSISLVCNKLKIFKRTYSFMSFQLDIIAKRLIQQIKWNNSKHSTWFFSTKMWCEDAKCTRRKQGQCIFEKWKSVIMNRKVHEKIRFNPYKEITGDTEFKLLQVQSSISYNLGSSSAWTSVKVTPNGSVHLRCISIFQEKKE